jgi:chromosome segregation ATPase
MKMSSNTLRASRSGLGKSFSQSMTTKQQSSPQAPKLQANPVANAEAVLARLQAQREKLTRRQAEHETARSRLAYAARAQGDAEASKRLSEMADEAVHSEHEARDIEAALTIAQARLKEAQVFEAREVETARAVQMRAQIERLRAAGQTIDDALTILVEAAGDIHKAVDEIHMLGFGSPNHQQVLSLGERAIRTAIMQTMWARCIEIVAPSERTTFVRFIAQWQDAMERRPGEQPKQNERAA